MKRIAWLFWPLISLVLTLSTEPQAWGTQHEEPPSRAHAPGPRIGMTMKEVRKQFGPPQHMSRQILYLRYLEQWIYQGNLSCRVEFDCRHGKEPLVRAIYPLHPRKP